MIKMGGRIGFNFNYLNRLRSESAYLFVFLHPVGFSPHYHSWVKSCCCKSCKQAAESSTELSVCEGNGCQKGNTWPREEAKIQKRRLIFTSSPI